MWTASHDQAVRVWSTSGKMLTQLKNQPIFCMAQVWQFVWCGTTTGKIIIYNSDDFSIQRVVRPDVPCIQGILFYGGVVWVAADKVVVRMDPRSCKLRDYLQGHKKIINDLDYYSSRLENLLSIRERSDSSAS